MYKCKNTSEEGVCQSRVYVNLAYMFRVYTCILITYINVSRIRVKKVYVSLECMSMTSEESVCQYIKKPSKGSVCQSRVYVNLDIYRSDDS